MPGAARADTPASQPWPGAAAERERVPLLLCNDREYSARGQPRWLNIAAGLIISVLLLLSDR